MGKYRINFNKKNEDIINWDEATRVLIIKDTGKVTFILEPVMANDTDGNKAANDFKFDMFDTKTKASYSFFKVDKKGVEVPKSRDTVYHGSEYTVKGKPGYKEAVLWVEFFEEKAIFRGGKQSKESHDLGLYLVFQRPDPIIEKVTWIDPKSKKPVTKKSLGQYVILRIKAKYLEQETIRISLWEYDGSIKSFVTQISGKAKMVYAHEGYKGGSGYTYKQVSNEAIDPETGEKWKGTEMTMDLGFAINHHVIEEKLTKNGDLDFLIHLNPNWVQDRKGKDNMSDKVNDSNAGLLDFNIELCVKIEHPKLPNYEVKSSSSGAIEGLFYGKFLNVDQDVVAEEIPLEASKMVAAVVQNDNAFEAKGNQVCKFNFIEIIQGKRSLVLFEETKKGTVPSNIKPFEIIAGPDKNKKKVTINLVNKNNKAETQVTLCKDVAQQNTTGAIHKDNLWKILATPEALFDKKTQKEADTKSRFSLSSNGSIGVGNNKITSGSVFNFDIGEFEKLSETQTELSFNARYIYNTEPLSLLGVPVSPLFRYFWLGGNLKPNIYKFYLQSCRYQKQVLIQTYPDIAWELSLNFNNNTTSKAFGSGKVYNKKSRAAKWNPKEEKWIAIGDKWVGFALDAKFDSEEKCNISLTNDFAKRIEGALTKINQIGDLLNGKINNSEGKDVEGYDAPTHKDREKLKNAKGQLEKQNKKEVEERKKTAKELTTLKNDFKANKEALKKHPKGSSGYKDAKSRNKTLSRKMDKRAAKHGVGSLTRKIVGVDIVKPSLSLGLGWKRQSITDKDFKHLHHTSAVVFEGFIKATPFIGASIYLDFLALAQRAHPVALAVIAAADLTLALIGSGSKITCELRLTGTVGGELKGFLNTATGKNTFNETNKGDVAKITSSLKAAVKIQIDIKGKKDLVFVAAEASVTAKLEAEASMKADVKLGADDRGWYLHAGYQFMGLEIKGGIKVKIETKTKEGEWGEGEIKKETESVGAIDQEFSFKWIAIPADKKMTMADKVYF
ncbi:hypothetical protein [Tenacibaculum ovolyticum]|uniref:hypothetical protein n=1 Tax=Tenacibaculum ovolyticum TaxID=104270 RepID=UPI0007ECD397|nr:hypothetical protein [Tenacibaculum ovolyticum]